MPCARHLLISLLVFINSVTGSVVRFEATPNPVLLNLTSSAEMRCSVTDDGADNLKHVTSVTVTNSDGSDVAMVTAFDAPAAFVDIGNLQAKGSVSAVKGEGDLQMTWSKPSLMTFGTYTCTVHAIDPEGHHQILAQEVTVRATTPTVMDWVNDLSGKVSNQQQEISQLHSDSIKQQQEISKLQSENAKLQLENQNITLKLQACLINVAFMAAMSPSRFSTGRLTVSAHQTVTYDDVLLNIGDNYDPKTGIFKCVVPGVYTFHSHAMNSDQDHISLNVLLNSAIVASTYGGYTDMYESDSVSVVLHLTAGDEVQIKPTESSTFHYEPALSNSNTFSGHIVKADACSM